MLSNRKIRKQTIREQLNEWMSVCVCVCAHRIEFELHIIIICMLRKFPVQFLRNQPNNNDGDEQTRRKHRFISLS